VRNSGGKERSAQRSLSEASLRPTLGLAAMPFKSLLRQLRERRLLALNRSFRSAFPSELEAAFDARSS